MCVSGDLGYANEKFAVGVRILATGSGRIRERLLDAYRGQIIQANQGPSGASLKEPQVPDDLATDIAALHERMTRSANAGQGTVEATVNAMTDEEARETADWICSLAYQIEAAREIYGQRAVLLKDLQHWEAERDSASEPEVVAMSDNMVVAIQRRLAELA